MPCVLGLIVSYRSPHFDCGTFCSIEENLEFVTDNPPLFLHTLQFMKSACIDGMPTDQIAHCFRGRNGSPSCNGLPMLERYRVAPVGGIHETVDLISHLYQQ